MLSSVFKLTDLQQRREPKKEVDRVIQIKGKAEAEAETPDFKAKVLEEEDEESEKRQEPVVAREPMAVTIKDKRATTKLDRELILKRLQRPIENKKISQSPEQEEELPPLKKSKPATKEGEPKGDVEGEPNGEAKGEAKGDVEGDVEGEPEPSELQKGESLELSEEEIQEHSVEELSKESEELVVTAKAPKKGKAKAAPKRPVDENRVDLSIAKIGDLLVKDRLPPPMKYAVPVSSYYMNNRKIYISKLAQLFRPYSEKIASKAAEMSCKSLQSQKVDFELLTHQLVVRDYLNLYTPYRGLLLYHGLGSGKTCTSIAIAEGMKSGKKIVLMTPASLKMNFFNELKKCGDVLYKKNQFWEFISLEGEPQRAVLLAQVLGLDTDFVRKQGGAWLMNVKKKANFADLSDRDQKSVDQQIDHMIRNKYIDINYNGLQQHHIEEMTHGGKVNPFDNKVVIIDEAHNLVSRISNTGGKRGSIAYRLYHDLMDATNAKIIFLTGTPIINTPREIAILFNMLRGYIKTWTFTLEPTTSDKVNTEILTDEFRKEGLAIYDFVEYTTNKLVITRNPFGFVNVYKDRRGKRGGAKSSKRVTKRNLSDKAHNRKTKKAEIYDDDYDVEREKEYNGLNNVYEGGVSGSGMVSESNLLIGGAGDEDYEGVRLDEMGNISDPVFVKRLTKILENKGLRVVGTPKVKKELCLPDDDLFYEKFINGEKGELIHVDVLKRRILGLTSYFRSAQEQLLPSFVKPLGIDGKPLGSVDGANYHLVNIDMSDFQFEEYEKVRKNEREEEKRKRKKTAPDEESPAGTYRIYSRSACNFVFPAEHPRPKGRSKLDTDVNTDENFQEDDKPVRKAAKTDVVAEVKQAIAEKAGEGEGEEAIEEKIQAAYDFLRYNPENRRSKEYLTEEGLKTYSPKFLAILRNVIDPDHKGLHLIYSQWRTLEGIGLFKLVLEANGFVEFKLTKKGTHWEIEDWDKDPEKPRFALYTGTETAEEKDIVRNVFNGSWHLVPPSIVEKLEQRNADNLYGEVIKVLMITASGAEGINLRNTRYVHIMEPYWNMVRVDQVVGRARRICSHEDLPEALRTVEVWIYLCQATLEQIDKNIELRIQDLSKLAYTIHDVKRGREIQERVPFTTDQYLLEIAQIKDSITRQILTAVKETAIDCSLYNNNPAEPLVCYGFGKVEAQSFASYPTLERDEQEKPAARKETKRALAAITLDEVKYVYDKNTLVVYDFASYQRAKEKKGELQEIGRLDMRTQTILFA
jgi:hypothetical protein